MVGLCTIYKSQYSPFSLMPRFSSLTAATVRRFSRGSTGLIHNRKHKTIAAVRGMADYLTPPRAPGAPALKLDNWLAASGELTDQWYSRSASGIRGFYKVG
jgi:hypothetical protein